jgi:sugar-specific transcriptional regulator TrmB
LLPKDEAVQTLVDVGLTVLQARAYIALAGSGTSTARATSKIAKVAPQDIYRVLAELQEKGLIEKIISKPNKYRPIPLEEGIPMLLQRRDKQTAELKKTIFEIFKNPQSADGHEDNNETEEFALISGKETITNRVIKLFGTAQESLKLINNFEEGMMMHENLFELEVKALDKGVKIKDILSKTQKRNQTPKSFSRLLKRQPEFQVRYLNAAIPAKIAIKDNKEVIISTKTEGKPLEQPALWSSNPVIVKIIQQWYDTLWEKSSRKFKDTIEIVSL